MNKSIEWFGSLLGNQAGTHPLLVQRTLSLAYRWLGFQASCFPDTRHYLSSREYIQGYTASLLSNILAHPERAAVVNIFMSCEIFHVLGLQVSAPEALAIFITNTAMEQPFIKASQEKGASENLCSFHQSLLGMAEMGVLRAPKLVANTTMACDANQLSFRRLSEIWHVPHFIIDVPYDISEHSVEYVSGQLKELQKLAEDCTGKKASKEALEEAVARSVQTQKLYNDYLKKRPRFHLPEAMSPELLTVISNHLYLGHPSALRFARYLNDDLAEAPPSVDTPRLLWMHVLPNAQEPVKDLFQGGRKSRFEMLACDLAYDNIVEMDPKKPYEAMARRIVCSSWNGSGLRRIHRTLELAKTIQADGILIFCQWGCKQTQGIAFAAKEIFEAEGFRTLILDGDACNRANEASGQAVTRLEAFYEEIILQKRR